jgi:ElaB/YqjD/DUF883 family membrane-anchored ribosome-binding protein
VAITETIDTQIESLVEQLSSASDKEAERIRNRIFELKQLKKEHTTT